MSLPCTSRSPLPVHCSSSSLFRSSPSATTVIVVSEIVFQETCYSIDGKRLVGPLNLQVEAGETIAFLGASGSGKTTTLRLVNGLLIPSAGSVSVAGKRTDSTDLVTLRRSIGYVIQEVGLLPHMTIAQNTSLVLRLLGRSPAEMEERTLEMLSLVHLEADDLGQRYPHQLSGGQRQRVGVARALAANPSILLCDEPFGSVDAATRRLLQREFFDLTRTLKKTVIFVTHDVREATYLGDRIAVFEGGEIGFLGTSEEFETSETPCVTSLRDP